MKQLKEHPQDRKLAQVLKKFPADLEVPWNRPVYRCVDPGWARPEHLISGEGSRKNGSRWMPPGQERAVYGSSSEIIALKESRRTMAYYGIMKPRKTPRVSVEIRPILRKVADLRRLREFLPWPDLEELLAEDWEALNAAGHETLSQALGRYLAALGFEALLAPSTRDRRGRNLVWFPDRLLPESEISISGEKTLKNWLKRPL